MAGDVVGVWEVPLSDRIHRIEFEHGTTTGRRVIRVDGQEVIRKDWQFKLVGSESFNLPDGKTKCDILIRASNGFTYDYTLLVDGKLLRTFKEKLSKVSKTWNFCRNARPVRVVLEKETLDIWVNGKKVEAESTFADEGTSMVFPLDGGDNSQEGAKACIRTISSGNKREGIVFCLIVDDQEIPETLE